MAKQVFDVHPSARFSRDQSTEHLRNYKVVDPDMKKWGYYDPTRMHLNFEVQNGKVVPVDQRYHIDKRLKDSLNSRGLTMPAPIRMKDGTLKNRRAIANIMLYGSRDRMLELAFGSQKVDLRKNADNSHLTRHEDIEKWAVGMYNLMAEKVGKENIIAFVVHLDEKNPHIHCTVTPVNEKEKFSYNDFFGGTKSDEKMLHWHDDIAKYNASWGLERGDNINITGARHRTSEEYWTDLRNECSRLEKEVNGFDKQLKLIEGEIRRAEIKHKGLTTMIANKQQVLQDLEDEVNSDEYLLQENQHKNNQLQILILDNQRTLDDKKKMLEETDEKLILLKQKYQEMLLQKDTLEKETQKVKQELANSRQDKLDTLETNLFSQLGKYLTYLPNMIGQDLEKLKSSMTLEQRESFDKIMNKTFLKEMTENPDDIIRTAASFYLGSPSSSSQAALTAGGVGVHPVNWKKRPDEDDDAYMYRCVAMACMVAKRKRGLKR